MKKRFLITAFAVAFAPFLTSQANIEQPEVQFKTLEQIQAEALEKESTQELTERQQRRQRLLQLTRSVSSSSLSDTRTSDGLRKKRTTTSRIGGIRGSSTSKKRSFRGTRAQYSGSRYANTVRSTRTETGLKADIASTIKARQRMKAAKAAKMEAEMMEDTMEAEMMEETMTEQ